MNAVAEGSITGVDGTRLAWHAWEATAARAALVVVHGHGEHGGRYHEFGARMAAGGISTFALDLRGHGMSEGRRGHVQSFDVFLQELDRFRREVDGLAGRSLPMFLLGHSMGGLIALRYQQEYAGRFAGAVIVSPWLATAMQLPRVKVAASNVLSKLLPALPFRTGLDAAHISRDPAVVERYREDPLVHSRITPRLFTEVSTAMGLALQRRDRLRPPLLVLLAGDDRLVDTDRALRFANSIAGDDTTVRVFDGAYHELLNEVDRVAVHGLVRDWIIERTGAGS